jgi:hypothetical protein
MERFKYFLDEIIKQFKNIEEFIRSLMAKVPYIGSTMSDYSNLIALVIVVILTVLVIKPLVKWSLAVLVLGVSLAGVISFFAGLSFWGVLPLTALVASVVLFSNKFSMG